MKHLLTAFVAFIILSIAFACSQDDVDIASADAATERIPSMVTHDVSMLISDSGVIRYRATTPVWIRYGEDPQNKYQYFPEGIDIYQIDSAFQATANIHGDTAYNYENTQTWHLIKNVVVRNLHDEEFHTSELFWDMRVHRVYSDSFVHIERPDAIIEGYGFESSDDFSNYTLRQTSGVFPMQDPGVPAGEEPTDE